MKVLSKLTALAALLFLVLGQRESMAFETTTDARSLRVAILGFENRVEESPVVHERALGAVRATLSSMPGVELIDQYEIGVLLIDNQVDSTRSLQRTEAVSLGKQTGADLVILGKIYTAGGKMWMTAKIIGVSRNVFSGVIVHKKRSEQFNPQPLIQEFSKEISARVKERVDANVFVEKAPQTSLETFRQRLETREKPPVATIVFESTENGPPELTSATASEIEAVLKAAGIPVVSVDRRVVADWLSDQNPGRIHAWPDLLGNVQILVAGRAVARPTLQNGELYTWRAEARVQLLDRQKGNILFADRVESIEAHESPELARVGALRKCGAELGERILGSFLNSLPEQRLDH